MKLINKVVFAACLVVLTIQTHAFSIEDIVTENDEKPLNLLESKIDMNVINRNYILGPGDVININFNIPDFNMPNVKINPDGKVSLKYFGTTKVEGMSVDHFENILKLKYRYYIKDPKPNVEIAERRSFVAYVFGCVMNPGLQEISDKNYQQSPMSSKAEIVIDRRSPYLSNVLLAAGGVTEDADIEHVKITNKSDNTSFEVNLLDFIENGKNRDIMLMPGDIVSVPKLPDLHQVDPNKFQGIAKATFSPKTVPIRVFGYVNAPGLKQLDPGRSLNLNSAIAAAGGYTINSPYPAKYVVITRMNSSGHMSSTKVNPMKNDIALMPNDIIYVPEKPRQIAGKAFDYTARLIAPLSMFASGYNNWALIFDPKRFNTTIMP